MFDWLMTSGWVLLAAADGGAPGGGAAPGPGNPLMGLLNSMLLPFIAIGFLFYFLMIRPERRKRAELTETLNNLKKNDRVVTIGGIYGVVVNVQKGSEEVTLRVDENRDVKMRVLRSAISRVVTAEGSGDKKDAG